MSLSSANGAARERARAFLDGWTVADRTSPVCVPNERPWRFVDLDMEPTTPVNGVLLGCFLRGMYSRFGWDTAELEEQLAIVGD